LIIVWVWGVAAAFCNLFYVFFYVSRRLFAYMVLIDVTLSMHAGIDESEWVEFIII